MDLNMYIGLPGGNGMNNANGTGSALRSILLAAGLTIPLVIWLVFNRALHLPVYILSARLDGWLACSMFLTFLTYRTYWTCLP